MRGAPEAGIMEFMGKAGYIVLWLLEVSIPILVLIFLLRHYA